MLTLGWSDGNTFIPFNFTLLSSAKRRTGFVLLMNPTRQKQMVIKEGLQLLKMTDAMIRTDKTSVKL